MLDKIKNIFKKTLDSTKKVVDATLNNPAVKFVSKPVEKAIEYIGDKKDIATGKKAQEEVAATLSEWERLLKACTTRIETLEMGFSKWEERLSKVEIQITGLKYWISLSVILNIFLLLSVIVLAIKVFH